MTRPIPSEQNRHPTWELVDILGTRLNGSLVPDAFDYISLGYTGTDLTSVVYKEGGAGGTTVATLTLAYAGGALTSVTKT